MEALFEKKRRPYAKIAVALAVILAAAALYYGIVFLQTFITSSPRMVDLYYKKADKFNEEQKTAIKKNNVGYWVYRLDTVIAGSLVKKTDNLEIKDNGIIWQVVEWTVTMPSGVITTLHQMLTAYCNPFGAIGGDTLHDALIIAQAFITGSDTCFGAWYIPEMWEMHKTGEMIVLARRKYQSYTGDIAAFFPQGMIGLVERAENQLLKDSAGTVHLNTSLCSIRKVDPKTGKVSLFPIRESLLNLSDRFKEALFDTLNRGAMKPAGLEDITSLLAHYYQPFFISEPWRVFPRPLPQEIAASFTVTAKGTVENIKLPHLKIIGKIAYHGLQREFMSWRFQPPEAPIRVAYTFKLP